MSASSPASRDAPVIRVRGLVKTFGEGPTRVEALRGVDLDVMPSSFVVVMGPSGSGKSTLLHLVGGLDRPDAGSIEVAGRMLGALDDDALTVLRRRHVGFVFQAFNLVLVLTALENVALPLRIDGVGREIARARALTALEDVGLAARAHHLPSELSGGEQQRVAAARALATEPDVLLADEPTGNLDRRTGDELMALLRRLSDERGLTVVMVTHDARDAARADRLVRIEDGRVVLERPIDEAERARGHVDGGDGP